MTQPWRRERHPEAYRVPPTLTPTGLLTTTEMARILQIAPRTVLSWAIQDLIPSIKTPGGHRRFEEDKVVAIVEARREAMREESGP